MQVLELIIILLILAMVILLSSMALWAVNNGRFKYDDVDHTVGEGRIRTFAWVFTITAIIGVVALIAVEAKSRV